MKGLSAAAAGAARGHGLAPLTAASWVPLAGGARSFSAPPEAEAWAKPGVRPMPVDDLPPVYPEGTIYKREREDDIFRQVHFEVAPEDDAKADPEFRALVNKLFNTYRPSDHSFFETLKTAPTEVVHNEGWLNEFYDRYQAAMHITRAMVWYAPYLDTPIMRQRKCAIIADDDALGGKRSHHRQLMDMFSNFGGSPRPEEEFGEPHELRAMLDDKTSEFVNVVERLYPKTTGAWCIAEVLSDDWLSALAESFEPHFEGVKEEQYFDEIFSGHVEVLHMLETVAMTEDILIRHPEVRDDTFAAAREMCEALNALWDNLEDLVKNPKPYMT